MIKSVVTTAVIWVKDKSRSRVNNLFRFRKKPSWICGRCGKSFRTQEERENHREECKFRHADKIFKEN